MKTENPFEIFINIIVSGDEFDSEKISIELGMLPDKVEIKGERKSPRIETYYESSRWVYKYVENSSKEVNLLLEDLVGYFSGISDKLEKISGKMDLVVYMAIYRNEYWPAIILDKEIISFMDDIGAKIEIDLIG